MASVQLPKDQTVWNAHVRIWDAAKGKATWACWSTGQRDKEAAQLRAEAYQEASDRLFPGSPERDSQMLLKRVFRMMCERAGVFVDDIGDGPAFAQFAGEWLKRRGDKNKDSTSNAYRGAVDDFSEFLGRGGDVPMGTVTAVQVQRWYDGILEAGRSSGTAKNKFKVIASIFKRAHDLGLIRLNPSTVVETLNVVQEERDPFSEADEKKVFKWMGDHHQRDWFTASMLGRWAGLRIGDASNLTAEKVVKVDGHTLLQHQAEKKTRKNIKPKPTFVPVLKPLAEYIEKLGIKSGPLCPSLAGIAVGCKNGLSARFATILEDAGVDRRRVERGKGGRPFHRISFHSWRHTLVTRLDEAGVDKATRMHLADHEDADVHEGYTHRDAVKMAQRLQALGL